MTEKLKAPKIVIAPKDTFLCVTSGKEYTVVWDDGDDDSIHGYGFGILDDSGFRIYCLEKECEHLNGGNWIIKER